MKLDPALARQIARGEKTQHREPIRPAHKRPRYHIGHIYSIRARGQDHILCHVEITTVTTAQPAEISIPDCRAEGFKTRADFYAHWQAHHGCTLDTPAHVFTLRLTGDVPRLLRRTPPRRIMPTPDVGDHHDHGYTRSLSLAIEDAGEAVDADTQRELTANAEQERLARHASQEAGRRRKPLEVQLAEVRAQAKHQGCDLGRQEAAIIRQMDAMRARLRREAAT